MLCFVPLPKMVPTAVAFGQPGVAGSHAASLLVGTADGRIVALQVAESSYVSGTDKRDKRYR